MTDRDKTNTSINFIVGMGRSGTTLLTNILHRHPQIISTPENNFLLFTKNLRDKDFQIKVNRDTFIASNGLKHNHETSIWSLNESVKKDLENVSTFCEACISMYKHYDESKQNASIIVDKNPIYTLHIQKLSEILPNAKFIAIVRDYRDNIVSRKKHFTGWINSDTLHACAWKMYYQEILAQKKKLRNKMLIIRYEDIIQDTKNTIQKICDHLNVSYHTDMESPDKNAELLKQKAIKNLGSDPNKKVQEMHANLEKPINADKSGYWKNELKKEEVKIIETICGKTAENFGYEKSEEVALVEGSIIHLKKNFISLYLYSYMAFFNFYYYHLPLRIKMILFKTK